MKEKKILHLLGDTSKTALIPSKAFPTIKYRPAEDVWVDDLRKNRGEPLSFDLSMDLTKDAEAIKRAAAALDDLDGLEARAREYMKEIASNPKHTSYEALRAYFNLHGKINSAGSEQTASPVNEKKGGGSELSALINQLTLARLGSMTHKELQTQVFIMDFSFTQQYGEEILAVYLDRELRPFVLSVES